MPIYEYRCETCTCEFEELVRGNEPVSCPNCASASVRRKMSTFSQKSCQNGGHTGDGTYSTTTSGSGCGGCSGGNCACCHHH